MRQGRRFVASLGLVLLLGIALALSPASPAASARGMRAIEVAPPESLIGNWLTQGGDGVIAIERCGPNLCGRIVGILRAPSEPVPTDVHGASQCGLTILHNEKVTDDGFWQGEITDPRDGTTYGAQLWLDEHGDLNLRGFLGIPLLGRTQVWHRFTGTITQSCGIA
jgi:uncharacterized protein (DUF2147 family)